MTSAEILAAFITGGSLIVAALATHAAFRSARSAEAAQQSLIDGQLSAGRLSVVRLVSECEAELRRVRFLGGTLTTLNRHLSVMSGAYGGSRMRLLEDEAAKRIEVGESAFQPATRLASDPTSVGSLVSEDIDRLQLDLTTALAKIRSVAIEFERESAGLEAQLLQARASAFPK